jgi:Tfp pilus assembly protein PilN
MAHGINFLSKQHKKVTNQQKKDRQWFRYSLMALGVVVVVTVASVATSYFFQFQLNHAQAKAKDLERQVLANEEVEKSAAILVKKLAILKDLFDERQDKQQALEYFTNLFGPNVVLKDIQYQSTEGILSLRLQAQSVFELERVFGLLALEQTVDRYGNVARSELRRDEAGFYEMTITIVFTKQES